MRNMLKSTLAGAVLTVAALTLAPSAASAGVVGLSDQEGVAPASVTETVHWRPYCHRHYRHYGYCGTCRPRFYAYAYPVCRYATPGYYGYAAPAAAGGLLGLGLFGLL